MPRSPAIKRTYKKLSAKEAREYDGQLAKVERDAPELKRWARAGFARDRRLREIFSALKAARKAQQVSLAELDARTGIGKGNLSKLENDPRGNPTLETILRYADAIGVDVRISVGGIGKAPRRKVG